MQLTFLAAEETLRVDKGAKTNVQTQNNKLFPSILFLSCIQT